MEQLAQFVTKSFEYNNNRVMDVLNMSIKDVNSKVNRSSETSEILSFHGSSETDGDEDSIDIDITDLSTTEDRVNNNNNSNSSISRDQPLSLVKKIDKDMSRHKTRNWLISDSPKRKLEGLLDFIRHKLQISWMYLFCVS